MEVVERGTNTMRKSSRNCGIPLFFLGNHLNGRIRSKRIGFGEVLIDEENVTIIRWELTMQEVGWPITLQQLKMKMVEFTQTRPIPFYNGNVLLVGGIGLNIATLNSTSSKLKGWRFVKLKA
jgi:hypothetical protein